jgi:mono/diheme cytochrome c family protein/plastocyanin
LILLLNLLALPAAILGFQFILRPALVGPEVVDIHARIPEAGGFSPASVQVVVGQTVTLRFSSLDAAHSVAIGPGVDIDLGTILPGQFREVALTFDRPGRHTYYCNTWCSINHWRMRGVIEVVDATGPAAETQRDPVIDALIDEGIDIDAVLHLGVTPAPLTSRPSAATGAVILKNLIAPADVQSADWRRSHTPQQAMALLAAANPSALPQALADAAAYLWTQDEPADPTRTADLYAKNCAYCHGVTGGGDGLQAGLTAEKPVAFADAAYMFARRSDVLYAKIRRGGMGTDMPNFGTLFTPEETWALIDYLWSLAVEDEPTAP